MIDEGSETGTPVAPTVRNWARLAALALVILAVGVPINRLPAFGLLLIAVVLIFCGNLTVRLGRWLAALAVAAVAAVLPLVISVAPIAVGENVFLPARPGNVFERQLPADVYAVMKAEFDRTYPPAVRCAPGSEGCWQSMGQPDRLYGFAADGVFDRPAYSRSVRDIDFSDAIWLRLGAVNDLRYNWYTVAPDVHRGDRDRRFWMGPWRWKVAVPWFAMYEFPADYAGSSLCWHGVVLWEGADGHYQAIRHADESCRVLGTGDIGRHIFAVAMAPGTLAMTLHPPAHIRAKLMIRAGAALLAVIALLALLVRLRPRNTVRPFLLIGLALAVTVIIDGSFVGGWFPMEGGDDGLFYTGVGREILQHLMRGDIMTALMGGEAVYYYGGPGLRYFRALEMVLFGDTNLGYLSLVLVLPFVVWGLFRRFVSETYAWRLTLVFIAIPLGEIFGSSFLDYAKWAARGFADPAAHILLLWGVLVVVGPRFGPGDRAANAAGGALLMALAIFMKPIVAPLAGIVLGGAGIAALAAGQWRRVAGLCVGFLPVLVMPLHNWYFGHVFVLFSSNAQLPETYVMPPSAYGAAVLELLRLDFGGAHVRGALAQFAAWLSGPSESAAAIPVTAAAVAVVAYVTLRGRDFDPWLRLISAAVMTEYVVDLIFAATPRYYFGMWLLSAVVVATFIERRVPAWLDERGWKRTKLLVDGFIGRQPAGYAFRPGR